MKPKDWKDAMHNEAEAVSDTGWAHETNQAARLFGWRDHVPGFLVALVCSLTLSMTSNLFYSTPTGEDWLETSLAFRVPIYLIFASILLISTGIFLGRLKFSPRAVGSGFILLPLIDSGINIIASFITLSSSQGFRTNLFDFAASVQISSGMQFWIALMMVGCAALTYAGAVLGQRSSRRARTA
ncbi:hypothetical protein [Deinococcus puniceus]|uniref:Uncharacterized protein n=1 Tax=Deinococcus puniceus TaxID=1182568 RepID=A0A172T8Y4_9DEIO|nr:hypothetical protein [Deinococcus puniceus]ANE43404.1 hypothetical protein SU48_06075 [Deinococcus puniceus]